MRKIGFGIRMKITGVIMFSVIFVSSIIGLALYNSQIDSNKDEMLRLGGTIIKGGVAHARSYLNSGNAIKLERIKFKPSSKYLKSQVENRTDNFKALMSYFPEMVKKEKLLDISFLIKKDRRRNRSKVSEEYIYFKRKEAGVFSRSKYDPELKNSIVDYFDHNISIQSHLSFASGRKTLENKFIVVGYPVLNSRRSELLYRNYLSYKSKSLFDIENIKKKQKIERSFANAFTDRLVKSVPYTDYSINVKNGKNLKYLFYRLSRFYKFNNKKIKRSTVAVDFIGEVKSKSYEDIISQKDFRQIFTKLMKKNRAVLKKEKRHVNLWYSFFRDIKRKRMKYNFNEKLDALALKAYKTDLKGIIGITLHRKTFYSDIKKTGNDIFNLSLSILIRCLFIAIFFPGFIINSIRKLSIGAFKIGQGDFSHRIDMRAKDELGQLADQFNSMAGNLEKAREMEVEKQRMENELVTAKQIQETLLPLANPHIDGIELASYYSSASEAGGDYYDFIELSDSRLAIAVADVSGHGVGSGLVMAMTRTLLHTFLKESDDLKDMITGINNYLHKNTGAKYFVSMFLGIFDPATGKMRYVSCGHNPSYLVRKGDLKEIPAGGIALGVVGNDTFSRLLKVKSMELNSGDLFVQYTDGIPEMMDINGEEFGDDPFKRLILEKSNLSMESFVKEIIKSVDEFKGDALQHDDVTLVSLKYS